MNRLRNVTAKALVFLMGSVSSLFAVRDIAPLWIKTFGSEKMDQVNSIKQTSDGGYIFTGCQESDSTGRNDFSICKLNGSGDVQWYKVVGVPGMDAVGYSIEECTPQGGYVVAGVAHTESTGDDAFLVKFDSVGSQQWVRFENTVHDERAYSVAKSADGGYLIAGSTKSLGSGNTDPFVAKYDANGTKLWIRNYGSMAWDAAFQITPASDGNFLLVGETDLNASVKEMDAFVIKIDPNGVPIWTKTYGGDMDESGYSIQNCTDGGYIIAGRTFSDSGYGEGDAYLIKTDAMGNELWKKIYGGACSDVVYSVRQDFDGGYLLSGNTGSFGSDRVNAYLLKVDSIGTVLWRRTTPGTMNIGSALQRTTDSCYIMAINAPDKSGDVHIGKLAYTETEKPLWRGFGEVFTCVDSLSQIGFGGFKKTYWVINKFERLMQSAAPGNGASSKIMTPAFNIHRDTGVVRVSFNAGFPTEYGFNWQDHNELQVALCDDRNNELYTLRFKPNKPTDIGRTYDLKLYKDGTTLLASARTNRLTPHGAGSKMVFFVMDVLKNGYINVRYDANDGRGFLKYLETPDNSYRNFKKLKLIYKTGTAGDGNNYVTIDNLQAYETRE